MATVDVLELLIDVTSELGGVSETIAGFESVDAVGESVDNSTYEPEVDADTASAYANLLALDTVLDSIDEKEFNKDVLLEGEDLEKIRADALLDFRSESGGVAGDIKDRLETDIDDLESDVDTGILEGEDFELMKAEAEMDVESEVGDTIREINERMETDLDAGILSDKDLEAMKAQAALDVETEIDSDIGHMIGEGIDSDLDFGFSGKLKRRVGNITESLDNANLRMSQFYNLLADLLPLLFVFIAALPVVISSIIALGAAAVAAAGSLGAIGALGLFGMGVQEAGGTEGSFQEISSRLQELGSDILSVFAPLAERFAPLMRDALNGVLRTFERIAVELRGLLDLRQAARDFGQFVSDAVVGLVDTAISLTKAFLPVFRIIGDSVKQSNILKTVVNDFSDVLPMLVSMVNLIIGALSHIVELSKGFLAVAVTASVFVAVIYDIIHGLLSLFTSTEKADKALGFFIGSLLAVTTITIVFGKVLLALSTINKTFIGTMLVSAAATIKDALAKIYNATASIVAAKANIAYIDTAAGVAAVSITVVGSILLLVFAVSVLAGWVGGLTGKFGKLNERIKETQKSLEQFGKTRDDLGTGEFGATMGSGGSGRNVYYDNTVNINGGDQNTMRREAEKVFSEKEFGGQSTSR